MSPLAPTAPTLLIAADSDNDATLVATLLGVEFGNVLTSIDPDDAAQEFDRLMPDVLVLAFNKLEKSERYYLGLYRQSGEIHRQPHRTIILCNKYEVQQAYTFCRDSIFDDYVLFWPLTHDAPRLLMAVHHALRELDALKTGGPTAADFAAQARRLAELETLLNRQMAHGGQCIEETGRAIDQAEQRIVTSLDGFSQRLIQGGLPGAVVVKNAGELEEEISRLKRDEIRLGFRTAAKSVQPLKQWAHDFKQECAPHLQSIHVLNTMAEHVRPMVLVVDDDEFQHKITRKILEAENYRVVCAFGGIEALNLLHKQIPNLILMDYMMPDMNGIEVLRKIKAVSKFIDIPVIIITGKSEKSIVTESIQIGATDFVVKPFTREKLLRKVSKVLGGKDLPVD